MLNSQIAIIMTSSLILSSFTRRQSFARGVMGTTSFSCMPSTSHQLMGKRNHMNYGGISRTSSILPMRKTSSIVMWGEEDMPKRQKPSEYVSLNCYFIIYMNVLQIKSIANHPFYIYYTRTNLF